MIKLKHKKSLSIILAIVCLSTSACGKKTPDNIVADYENLSTPSNNIESDSENSIEDIQLAADHVSFTEIGDNLEVIVDADLFTDGFNTAKVYKEEAIEVDGEFVKDFASKIFDNGTYEIVKPYALYTPDENKNLRDELLEKNYNPNENNDNMIYRKSRGFDAQTGKESVDTVGIPKYTLDEYKGYLIGLTDYELEDLMKCRDNFNNKLPAFSPDQFVYDLDLTYGSFAFGGNIYNMNDFAGIISIGKIIGNINGNEYNLLYTEHNGKYLIELRRTLHSRLITAENYTGETPVNEEDQNICEYQKSLTDSLNYLNTLGFTDYGLAGSFTRVCGVLSDEEEAGSIIQNNGYLFYFTPDKDNVRGIYGSNANLRNNEEISIPNAITAEYDYKGLCRLVFTNVTSSSECIEDSPKLIPYDEAEKAFKTYVKACPAKVHESKSMKVNKIQLSYISLDYGNKKALVPAWVFYGSPQKEKYTDNDYEFPSILVAINALDGSILEPQKADDNWTNIIQSNLHTLLQ